MKTIPPIQALIEALISGAIFILLIGISTHMLYAKSIEAMDSQIKSGLQSTVQAAASTMAGDIHRQFNHQTKSDTPAYVTMAQQLESIRQASHDVRYIYTCILANDTVLFVVNPSPQNDADGDGIPDEPPALMTPYHQAPRELIEALSKQKTMVSARPYEDQWGRFISAYAPFYDAKGEFAGVLAMDLELSRYDKRLESIEQVFDKANIIIAFLGLIVGLTVWWIRLSDANHLNFKRTQYQQTKADLLRLKHINIELLWLVEHFSQQFVANSRTNLLLQYAQSLNHSLVFREQRQLSHWYNELKQRLSHHNIQLEHQIMHSSTQPAFLYTTPLLVQLTQLLSLLTSYRPTTVVIQSSLIAETLSGWRIKHRCYLNDEQRNSAVYNALYSKKWDRPVQHTAPSDTMLKVRTLINMLHQLDMEFIAEQPNYFDLIWTVYKEGIMELDQ